MEEIDPDQIQPSGPSEARRPPSLGGDRSALLLGVGLVGVLVGGACVFHTLSGGCTGDRSREHRVEDDFLACAAACAMFREDHGRWPRDFAELMDPPRLEQCGPYLAKPPLDPWTQEFYLWEVGASGRPQFTSYGADMEPGGTGWDADIRSADRDTPRW